MEYIKKILNNISPKLLVSIQYFIHFRRFINFNNPRDLNEKINWLKFKSDTKLWTLCADKYRVREYIHKKGLDEILVELYGNWNSVEDVDWSLLPNSFVLKTNNGSGDILICKDKSKLNIVEVKKKYSELLSKSFSETNGEPHYSNMKPCLIAEEMLDCKKQNIDTDSLIDYKIWCFNGKPYNIFVCSNRTKYSLDIATYDLDWVRHDEYNIFSSHYRKTEIDIPKPKTLDRMLEIARILSEGFPQVRIDLYEVNDNPYFGEMTFTSAGGLMNYFTPDYLMKMGELIDLSLVKIK